MEARDFSRVRLHGELTAFASDANLLKHYCDKLSAQYLGFLHPYQFVIDGKQSKK